MSLSRRLSRDRRGAAMVEFAIIALPFLLVLLTIIQMGIYYMTQSALDAGVNATATILRNSFNSAGTPTLPTGAQLKQYVVSNSGQLVYNTPALAVEIRQLSSLAATATPIADGTTDYGTTNLSVPLALRAQSSVVIIAPGFGALINVVASAIVRREGR
jgi:Flp pilus assembly protein TadG